MNDNGINEPVITTVFYKFSNINDKFDPKYVIVAIPLNITNALYLS